MAHILNKICMVKEFLNRDSNERSTFATEEVLPENQIEWLTILNQYTDPQS